MTKDEEDKEVIIIDTPEPKVPKKDHSPVNTPRSTPEPELVTPKKTAVDIQSFGFSPLEDKIFSSVSTRMCYAPITKDITPVKLERSDAFEVLKDIYENEPPSPESPHADD